MSPGVALLNAPLKRPTEKSQKEPKKDLKVEKEAKKDTARPVRRSPPDLKTLMEQMEKDSEMPMVQLGDASIASPFTSKSSAVMPGEHIIKRFL
jgi:cation-transporting ATPase 13A1